MKKNFLGLLIVVVTFFGLIMTGCSSTPLSREELEGRAILDPNISHMISGENKAILSISRGTYLITSINGTPVSEHWGVSISKGPFYLIPSGSISFRLIPYNQSGIYFNATTITFEVNQGRVYYLQAVPDKLISYKFTLEDITPVTWE